MWLGRENEENVARTRNGCVWPSSPPQINWINNFLEQNYLDANAFLHKKEFK